MSANKVYKVEVSALVMGTDEHTFHTRLIRAPSAAKAKKYVADGHITVEPLSIEDARTYAELPIEEAPE